jgi:hypothetical protein
MQFPKHYFSYRHRNHLPVVSLGPTRAWQLQSFLIINNRNPMTTRLILNSRRFSNIPFQYETAFWPMSLFIVSVKPHEPWSVITRALILISCSHRRSGMIPLMDQLEIYIVEDLEHEEFNEAGLSETDHAMVNPGAEAFRHDWQTMLNPFDHQKKYRSKNHSVGSNSILALKSQMCVHESL